jgi:hypothetical protein
MKGMNRNERYIIIPRLLINFTKKITLGKRHKLMQRLHVYF